jgi:antitoxin (DNA-binding transcriptional repressor) of toxin-antitoxin stability system
MGSTIQVSVRELHARTGHYVRKAAARQRVIVTDNGVPVAELTFFGRSGSIPFFAKRTLRPAFRKLAESGRLEPRAGAKDVTILISDDRD